MNLGFGVVAACSHDIREYHRACFGGERGVAVAYTWGLLPVYPTSF